MNAPLTVIHPARDENGLRTRAVARENGHTLVGCICQVIGEQDHLRYWNYSAQDGETERRELWYWVPQMSCACGGRGWVCATCGGSGWVLRADATTGRWGAARCPQCALEEAG